MKSQNLKHSIAALAMVWSFLESSHLAHAQAQMWSTKAPMPEARVQVAGAVFQDRFFVFGGSDGDGAEATPQIYDSALNKWSFGSPAAIRRSSMAVALLGAKIYLIGGWVNS